MKIFFLLVVLFFSHFVSAQIEKGDILLGGNISISTYSNENNISQTNATIAPQIGKIISQRSALGVGLNYTSYSYTSTSYSLTFDVFHRLYIPISPTFYFILHSQLVAGFGRDEQPYVPVNTSSYGISTGPRFAWFASPHWSFEANVGTASVNHSNGSLNSTQVVVSAGNVGLGVFYYFKKK